MNKLLEHKGSDGRYLVTRKVHWQAICRILVDHGIYPDGTDYRGFCYCMEGVCPANDCRVPLSYQSLKSIYTYLAVEKSEPSGSFARAV